ncbi:hypothetical protein M426DRAFT_257918 [Hypoxylon sp. CI-4A]|nr:hypothetical protein M426DRAFT_257918 [Hypoxylon sp. CI-4A]
MSGSCSQGALERRRTQNREAQRRFRRKKVLHASVDWDEVMKNTVEPPYIDTQSQDLYTNNTGSSSLVSPSTSSFHCDIPEYHDYLNSLSGDGSSLELDQFLEHTYNISTSNTCDSTFTSIPPHDEFSSVSGIRSMTSPGSSISTGQDYSPCPDPVGDCTSNLSDMNLCDWLSPLHILQQGGDSNEEDNNESTMIMDTTIGGHEDIVHPPLYGEYVGDTDDTGDKGISSALHWATMGEGMGVVNEEENTWSGTWDLDEIYIPDLSRQRL